MRRPRRRVIPLVILLSLIAIPASAANFVADFVMTQDEETPPTGSHATGTAHVVLDTLANTLTYTFTYTGARRC